MNSWLITYSQWTGTQNKVVNTVTRRHPADWLILEIKRVPDAATVLLYAVEINDFLYAELSGVI